MKNAYYCINISKIAELKELSFCLSTVQKYNPIIRLTKTKKSD